MFVDTATALRIERAEAQVMREMASALVGTARAPDAFVRELGAGLAVFVRPGSPMNKLAGALEPIDGALLAEVEQAFHAQREPVRAEIATLAAPQIWEQLTARGYQLVGFENVLARPMGQPVAARDETVERTTSGFRTALVEGFSHPDETGVVVDSFSRDAIETVIDDSMLAPGLWRYVASRDGAIAGAASMHVHDGVAVLTGSATLPAHRRRGVQAALLARRLDDARGAGATLAIITTAPGTQSQANVMKLGFSVAYARAVLVLGR